MVRRHLFTLAIMLVPGLLMPLTTTAQSRFEQEIEATRDRSGYVTPSPDEVAVSERLFTRLIAGERSEGLERAFDAAGWQLDDAGRRIAVVREMRDDRRGRGVYLVRNRARPTSGKAVMLQAPHRFKDLDTGRILLRLFEADTSFTAAALNTVPRRYDAAGREVDADLAHLTDTHYIAFSRAFARRWPDGRIIQLHGYSSTSARRSAAGRASDVIVSAGTADPSPRVRHLHRCLAARWPDREIKLYPDQVQELGGTTNTIGQALRAIDFDGFVHIELNRPVRIALRDQATIRDNLAACILEN